jgi:hypothetical protein
VITFSQSTGLITDDRGMNIGRAYSGFGEGKDNAALQFVEGVGPIPQGRYAVGDPFDSPRTGPYAMALTPLPGTNVAGRSDFEIHGDSEEHPGQASHGCIVISPKSIREVLNQRVWTDSPRGPERLLEVIA